MAKQRSIKEKMLKKFFGFVVSLFYGTAATAAVEPTSVLFIGNSYTHQNKMPVLFEKVATSQGTDVHVEMSALSNHTFEMHSKRTEMYETINSRKWDYIVLQGFSRELSHTPDHIDSVSMPYFEQILDSIYANNPCTNVMLYMTWGYKNGYSHRNETNTYEKMTDRVYEGYQYVSKKYSIPIAPVGHVWREVRKTSNINLYQKDNQHPTVYGSYISACTFYASIFKESPRGAHKGAMRGRYARKIQQTAFDYVMNNLDEFHLNRNTFTVKQVEEPGKGLLVECVANYPEAKKVEWDLGDGTTADTNIVKHNYQKPGIYIIELRIKDICGDRVMKRMLKFEGSRKSSRAGLDELRNSAVLPGNRKRTT